MTGDRGEEPIAFWFGGESPLADARGDLEIRHSQIEMAEAIDRTLREGGELLVEAGPGTGKTYAYLVPALKHASLPGRRVVISTWTRTLQEQIVQRDLPTLRRAMQPKVKSALVQGRENYVCRRRAEQSMSRAPVLFRESKVLRELIEIRDWAAESWRTGTRAELGHEPRREVWDAVRAETGNCMGQLSPFYRECAWQESRRRASESAVLIVNHALLLADLRLRREGASVLPPYSMLIVDEAHHLEEVAANHLGVQVGRNKVMTVLGQLERGMRHGFLKAGQRTPELMRVCRGTAVDLFEAAGRWLAGAGTREFGEDAVLPDPLSEPLFHLGLDLKDSAGLAESEAARLELASLGDRCVGLSREIEVTLKAEVPDYVYWVERGPGDSVQLKSSPVHPAPILKHELFAPLHASILTSATLTVPTGNDPFAFTRTSTGLDSARSMSLQSPFDFQRQAQVVLDPAADPSNDSAYLDSLAEKIPVHVARGSGRAFVLFTSRRTMEAVAERTRDAVEMLGIRLLTQGRGLGRSALLDQFRQQQPAVLYGLASFWEGVDVPGEELSHVILTRLPFSVPEHPWAKARAAACKKSGGDPFRQLAVPQAVLRFKQGFGRLIRTQSDRGWVTVLDPRVLTKGYGRIFLQALPACPQVVLRDGVEYPLGDSV